MSTDTITHEDHRSSAEIESDIRETRGRMDATLDELGTRLTPRYLLNTALDWWETPDRSHQGTGATKAATKKAAVTLARQARQHPMPALLIGSGIAWLIADAMDHGDDDHYQARLYQERFATGARPTNDLAGPSSSKLDDAKEAASGAMGHARERFSEIGDRFHDSRAHAGERAHDAIDRGKSMARRLKHELSDGYHMGADRVGRACDEYPLAIGAAFAALGALAGLAIPKTRREDEWMGERSDQLARQTKEKAGDLVQTGKAVGHRVLEGVKEEASKQGLTGDAVARTISEVAEKSGEVIHRAKEEAAQAAKEEGLKPGDEPESESIRRVGSGP